MHELTLQSRICFSGAWFLWSLPFECCICGGGWVVLRYCLKLTIRCINYGIFGEVLACVMPGATQYELQSYLKIAATCSGLGSAWEK